MWVLRRFPTGKSLSCSTTSLRNVFGETETETKEATPWWHGCWFRVWVVGVLCLLLVLLNFS